MNQSSQRAQSAAGTAARRAARLSWVAASSLWLVLAAVGWMIAAAYWPQNVRRGSETLEVLLVVALLFGALLLVSGVALANTARPHEE